VDKPGLPRFLKWVFFGVGIGTLTAAGIYLHAAFGQEADLSKALSALMFFLFGLFAVLMYGENRP
jgi:hypothetical protein